MIGLIFIAAAVASEPTPSAPASDRAATVTPTPPQSGSTGETLYTGAQIKAMGGKPPKLLTAPIEPNVDALYQQGIQGEMYFVGYVGADGKMHDVILPLSSRSKELDAVGLTLVNASTFTPATDASGKPIAAKVTFPVFLWKDSMMNAAFLKKSCAQFIIDADWFTKAFPEKRPDDYRGWLLFSGMVFASSYYTQSRTAGSSPKFEDVYARCKAHTNKSFANTYMGK